MAELRTAVVFAADAGYIMQLSTAIKSLFSNGYEGIVYVMNADIPQEWFQIVNDRLQRGQVKDLKINKEALTKLGPTHKHINYMTYARLLAPNLIFADRLLYLDSDVVVNGSLKPLLSMDLHGHIIGAVLDILGSNEFNAGVLLIDAKKWRERKITTQIWDQLSNTSLTFDNADQSLLNRYFGKDYLQLPSRYNYQIGYDRDFFYSSINLDKDSALNLITDPVIVHYLTDDKPWNLTSASRKRELWWHYYSLDWAKLESAINPPSFKHELLVFTKTAELKDIEKLIRHFPTTRFNIAAYVYMSFDLKKLSQYDNVKLYPTIIGKNIDQLINSCDAMLDITNDPDEEITKRFAATGKPIFSYWWNHFDNLLPTNNDYEFVHDVGEMIDRIDHLTNTTYGIIVKSIQYTLDYVIENHSSVARFGDGELDLINGHSIPYQKYTPELATRLSEILHTPCTPKFVVCLSDVFHDLDRYSKYASQFWTSKLPEYASILTTLKSHGWFGSTFISRPYIDLKDKSQARASFNHLKKLWDNQDLLIVEGKLSRSGVGNDLFKNSRSVKRIIGPSHNAFNRYYDLLTLIKNHAENKLILLMLGPTAKLLTYDLVKDGYQAIDLGHIDSEYEWFKMGATEKVPLLNKHTAEHNFDKNVSLSPNKHYDAQVIADLSFPVN